MLHLVDQGKLSLDDPVYPLLGKPRPLGRPTIDSQVEKITVRQLLLHAGGWNTKYHSDVLRQTQKISRAAAEKLPLSANAVLRYGLSQPLDFAPGAESHYSNFGYFLAKLVMERPARQPYETYVRQEVLRPMGISEMRMEQLAPAYAAREAHRYGGGWPRASRRPRADRRSGRELAGLGRRSGPLSHRRQRQLRGKPFLTSPRGKQMLAAVRPAAVAATQRLARRSGLGLGRAKSRGESNFTRSGVGSGRADLYRTSPRRHRLGPAAELRRRSAGATAGRERDRRQDPPGDRRYPRLARTRISSKAPRQLRPATKVRGLGCALK